MSASILGVIAIITLFFLMIIMSAIGHYAGKKRTNRDGITVTEGAVLTLMALLIAFTFSSASGRFDQRRALVVEEVNAISTAYLRLDLFEPQDRSLLQKDFFDYITSRINFYHHFPNKEAANAELRNSKLISARLWSNVINAINHAGEKNVGILVLPPINSMFDIASTRIAYTGLHLHYIIFLLLVLVTLLSAFIIGYGTAAKKHWLSIHILSYSLIFSATIYIILDIEFPRYGIIKSSEFDSLMVDLRNSMKPQT